MERDWLFEPEDAGNILLFTLTGISTTLLATLNCNHFDNKIRINTKIKIEPKILKINQLTVYYFINYYYY